MLRFARWVSNSPNSLSNSQCPVGSSLHWLNSPLTLPGCTHSSLRSLWAESFHYYLHLQQQQNTFLCLPESGDQPKIVRGTAWYNQLSQAIHTNLSHVAMGTILPQFPATVPLSSRGGTRGFVQILHLLPLAELSCLAAPLCQPRPALYNQLSVASHYLESTVPFQYCNGCHSHNFPAAVQLNSTGQCHSWP